MGLEPTIHKGKRFLRAPRMPFRHTGMFRCKNHYTHHYQCVQLLTDVSLLCFQPGDVASAFARRRSGLERTRYLSLLAYASVPQTHHKSLWLYVHHSAPGEIRTPDRWSRNPVLYPLSYEGVLPVHSLQDSRQPACAHYPDSLKRCGVTLRSVSSSPGSLDLNQIPPQPSAVLCQ
jgi:hypothetical protein